MQGDFTGRGRAPATTRHRHRPAFAMLFEVRRGKLAFGQTFADPDEALEAARADRRPPQRAAHLTVRIVVAVTSDSSTVADRRREWLRRARLYLVCEARPGGREPEELLRPALQAGVDVVQLREKHADDAGHRARRARRSGGCATPTTRCSSSTTGPSWRSRAPPTACTWARTTLPPGQVRRMVGEDALIGLSTHSPEQVDAARRRCRLHPRRAGVRDADEARLRAGRPRPRAVRGRARDACRSSRSAASTRATWARSSRAGAERVAVVRAIRDADDPGAAARALRAGHRARPCTPAREA